jgi:hypothetical protein
MRREFLLQVLIIIIIIIITDPVGRLLGSRFHADAQQAFHRIQHAFLKVTGGGDAESATLIQSGQFNVVMSV